MNVDQHTPEQSAGTSEAAAARCAAAAAGLAHEIEGGETAEALMVPLSKNGIPAALRASLRRCEWSARTTTL